MSGSSPNSGGTETLHYWRTRAGREVDFVVYGPGTFVALEVKRSRSVQRRDLAGLKAFREDYPESETVLLHLGPEPLRVDGIDCLPLECFLRGMTPGTALLQAR